MYIHEAIRARTAERPFITRKSWVDDYGSYSHLSVKLLPTDTPDCCVLETIFYKGIMPSETGFRFSSGL